MHLRNKIGQLLIMGFDGAVINEQSPVAQWLYNDGLGGVIFFDKDLSTGQYGKNLQDRAQIQSLLAQLHCYAKQCEGMEHLTLLTAIDYEGGAVDRLAQIKEGTPSLNALELAQLAPDALDAELNFMAQKLHSLGFNLNFAPIVDLNLNEEQGIIGALGRSFSAHPHDVVRVARRFVDVFSRYGIACSYKHFPGHGSAIGDTHEGFVDVTHSFVADELVPYQLLLADQSKPVLIMTAHVINKILDEEGLPATLSYKILTQLLRNTLGYEGVIISDDLQMHAIAQHYSLEESLMRTFNAGADMVIFGNQLGSITAPEVIDCIEQLVINKHIALSRIDEAYQRVIKLKYQIQ